MATELASRSGEFATGIVGFTSLVGEAQRQHNVSGTAPHCGFLVHALLGQRLGEQARRGLRHDAHMAELDRRIEAFNRVVAPVVERFGPKAPSRCTDCGESYSSALRV